MANLVAARLVDRAYAGEASWSTEDVPGVHSPRRMRPHAASAQLPLR